MPKQQRKDDYMTDIELFKAPAPPTDFACTVTPEAIAERDALVARAAAIQNAPATAAENEVLTAIGTDLQTQIKKTEEYGLKLRRPHNSRADQIMDVQKAYLDPLRPYLQRIGGFAATWRAEQERKADAERRARAEEISRLQEHLRQAAEDARNANEKGDLMGGITAEIAAGALSAATTAAIAKPEPEAVKTAGQSFRARELGWECTDVHALYLARPELCEPLKPKASAIKAICCPEIPVPGLRLWWQASVNFKSR
jgi:hypothetical protein